MVALKRSALPLATCLLLTVGTAMCGTVLTIITPGPQSHLFGMKKMAAEVVSRGHKVTVSASNVFWKSFC
jgi:glucuronosyltransferase